jgi:hypothetical protein
LQQQRLTVYYTLSDLTTYRVAEFAAVLSIYRSCY